MNADEVAGRTGDPAEHADDNEHHPDHPEEREGDEHPQHHQDEPNIEHGNPVPMQRTVHTSHTR